MKTILCILAAALALSACNTIEGMGKDIKAGGEKVVCIVSGGNIGKTLTNATTVA